METQVRFIYDEDNMRWKVTVVGAQNEQDARDAFAAVVATCHGVEVLLQQTLAPVETVEVDDNGLLLKGYKVTPAV